MWIFIVGMFFLVPLPVLVGIGMVLFKFFHWLYRKLIVRKKQKPAVKKEKSEKNKFWFYNVFLPCQIFTLLLPSLLVMFIFLWPVFYDPYYTFFEVFVELIINILVMCFLSCFFGCFYLLYQLVYFVCSKIFHSKYHTSWKLWLFVLVWLAIDIYVGNELYGLMHTIS